MKIRSILLGAAAICLARSPASSHTPANRASYPVRKCDDPKFPIGVLPKGFATVWFRLAKDGKPDTTSIAVLHLVGLSAGGVHSVAARTLSACRFDMGKPEPNASTAVVSDITFGDSTTEIGAATESPTPGTPLAIEPQGIPKDSLPLPIGDRRVEERPRRMSCAARNGPTPRTFSGRGATAAQAQQDAQEQARSAAQAYNAANSGTLVARVLVGIDGKPGSQVMVISVSNPLAVQNLAEHIGTCRFAPGRIHGIAVPAYIETKVP